MRIGHVRHVESSQLDSMHSIIFVFLLENKNKFGIFPFGEKY